MRFLHRNEREVIRVFFNELRPLGISEISNITGMSWSTARKYVTSSVDKKILRKKRYGKSFIYIINENLLRALESRWSN